MNTIVCVDKNWGIGKNNGMLFHLPKDLQYFKNITNGKVVVMGGNTLLSLPGSKPLPNRKNIVISDVFTRDDCCTVETLDELKNILKAYDNDDIFVIGGAMLYKTMLPYYEKAYITKVDDECCDATVFFPNLDEMNNWEIESESAACVDNGYCLKFLIYKNNDVKPFI